MVAPDKSRFIQDITIRNFKCFEELKIEGCGQFNLILGDNNVGKTSVLEALLVDVEPGDEEGIMVARLQRIRLDKHGISNLTPNQSEPLTGLIDSFSRNGNAARGFGIRITEKTMKIQPRVSIDDG